MAAVALLAGCAAPGNDASPSVLLAAAEPSPTCRLTVEGDRVVVIATPMDAVNLPPRVRTSVDAIAPDGELVFCGRERSPRGAGFRVEKRYGEPVPHMRSVLVDGDGHVLERSHTLPLPDAPQDVLAAALTLGPFVDSVEIVSGPHAEEYWRALVHDRRGRRFVAIIGLDGRLRGHYRRNDAIVDG